MRMVMIVALALGLSWGELDVAGADAPETQAVVCQAIGADLLVGLSGDARLDAAGQRLVTIIEGGVARDGGWATARWQPADDGRGIASFKAPELELTLRPVEPNATPGTKLSASVSYEVSRGDARRVSQYRCFCEVGKRLEPIIP